MNKSVAFAFIVLGLVGTIFGIQYIVENYNKPNDNIVTEEKLEDILPTLVIPNLYDNILEDNVMSLFYQFDDIDVSNMSNAMKLTLVVNNLYDKEYDKNSNNGTLKLNGKDVKEYYQKLYGNIDYIPETFTFFESDNCSRTYTYNALEDYYLIELPGCGGRIGPSVWKQYIKKNKEIKENEQIYIDYYVASYIKTDKEYVEQSEEPIQIYDKIFEKKIYMGKEINDTIINDLIKQNQISKYRLTYQKQSDGKYYFVRGTWIENTL